MPELPEVESIRRQLSATVVERPIRGVSIFRSSMIMNTEAVYFQEIFRENEFRSFDRRGKYLLGYLKTNHLLVVHLGMTGQLYNACEEEPKKNHTHIIWQFSDAMELRYRDVRRFGKVYLLDHTDYTVIPGLSRMGPEPLDEGFHLEQWLDLFYDKQKGPIKRYLLDQHFIAGIGNIYADESLFRAKIDPRREIGSLSRKEKILLYQSIREILSVAIEQGGSSIQDYINARGQKGGFQDSHCVYGKKDMPCVICGQPLRMCKIAGRTTTYCRFCQK